MSCDICRKQSVNMYTTFSRNSFVSHIVRLCITCCLLRQLPLCTGVLQTVGQPWPLPQSYLTGPKVQSLDSDKFQFRVTGKDCDILQAAIVRYYKIIFRTTSAGNAASLYRDDVLRFQPKDGRSRTERQREDGGGAGLGLGGLEVEVGQECADLYPSLDMDESCM